MRKIVIACDSYKGCLSSSQVESTEVAQILPQCTCDADAIVSAEYDLAVLCTVFEEIHAVRTLMEKTDFEFAGPSGCDSVNESLHGLDLFLFGEDCLCRIVIPAAGKREDADYQCDDEDIDA